MHPTVNWKIYLSIEYEIRQKKIKKSYVGILLKKNFIIFGYVM